MAAGAQAKVIISRLRSFVRSADVARAGEKAKLFPSPPAANRVRCCFCSRLPQWACRFLKPAGGRPTTHWQETERARAFTRQTSENILSLKPLLFPVPLNAAPARSGREICALSADVLR